MAGAVGALSRSHSTEGEVRREWWVSGAGGATRRKEEGRPGLGRATWMEDGVGGLVADRARGQRRRAPVDDVQAGEGMVVHVGHARRCGAAGERSKLGRPVSNSAKFLFK
jgi:hypothetical protein